MPSMKGGTMLAPATKAWIQEKGYGDLLTQLIALKEQYTAEHKPNPYTSMRPERLRHLHSSVKARLAKIEAAAARKGIAL